MPTFRICDVVVALPRTGGAAPEAGAGAAGEPGAQAGNPVGVTGCIEGTQAIYACVNGPSIDPNCVPSDPGTRLAMVACHHPSVVPTCVPSDPVTRYALQLCRHPSVVPTCVPSDPVTRRAVVESMSADELEILKRQLAEAIEQVERQQGRLRELEPRPPASLAEVDKLERKLKQALEDLGARRSELKRGGR